MSLPFDLLVFCRKKTTIPSDFYDHFFSNNFHSSKSVCVRACVRLAQYNMEQKMTEKCVLHLSFICRKAKKSSDEQKQKQKLENWLLLCRLNDSTHLGEHFEVAKGKWPRLITNMRRFVFMLKRDSKQLVIKHT